MNKKASKKSWVTSPWYIGGVFLNSQGLSGKIRGKNRLDVTIALHNSSRKAVSRVLIFKMNTEKKSLSDAEKMQKWREEKIKIKKAADRMYYEQNRERKIAEVQEN